MQRAVIRIQWRAVWHLVVALSIAALALPIVAVRLKWSGADANLPEFLTEQQLWGFFYPALAVVAAVTLAVATWISDRRGRHVYAMLLPIPRWRYVLLRYIAGLSTLVPIALALLLGAFIAIAGIGIPPGLRTFPVALALKFAITLLLVYGLGFAIASASSRVLGIAVRVAGVFLAVHIAVLLLHPGTNLLWLAVSALAQSPGPFAPLGGRWMLIDA